MTTSARPDPAQTARTIPWRARLVLLALFLVAVAVVLTTHRLLTDRFTETTRNRAELRLLLYSGNLLSELRQNAIVPQLLARDPTLIAALNSEDYAQSTQRLLSFVDEIGAASLTLLDSDGRVVAATERTRLGETLRQAPSFVDAIRSQDTVFKVLQQESGGFTFIYSRRIVSGAGTLGVILVEVDLQKFERAWAGIADAVMVTDSEGRIILSTEPRWRGLTEAQALAREPADSAIERAIDATSHWTALPADAYVGGQAVMRVEGRVAFRGWRIASLPPMPPCATG